MSPVPESPIKESDSVGLDRVPGPIHVDSSSDSEPDGDLGYQLLPQDGDGEIEAEWSEEDIEENSGDEAENNAAIDRTASNDENNAVLEPTEQRDVEITEQKVEEIKSIMAKFVLPASQQPVWAQELSEDAWNSMVATRIHQKSPENLQN